MCDIICSRTDDPDASKELLSVLGVDKLFDYMEIFPSQKFSHFRKYDFCIHVHNYTCMKTSNPILLSFPQHQEELGCRILGHAVL